MVDGPDLTPNLKSTENFTLESYFHLKWLSIKCRPIKKFSGHRWSGLVDGSDLTKNLKSTENFTLTTKISPMSAYKINLVVISGQGWSMDQI